MIYKKLLAKIFKIQFYKFNSKLYQELIEADLMFNATFRSGTKTLDNRVKRDPEFQIIKTYRKFQANKENLWGYLFSRKLNYYCKKYGVDFMGNSNFGKGLIIGHWGRIVINSDATFKGQILLTHGVTIGRDIRGKRKGSPKFGSRICIRANSTVTGNITIGDDVLIAPNTFVNFDVPSHSIVIGNPAIIHKKENATDGHLGWLDENN